MLTLLWQWKMENEAKTMATFLFFSFRQITKCCEAQRITYSIEIHAEWQNGDISDAISSIIIMINKEFLCDIFICLIIVAMTLQDIWMDIGLKVGSNKTKMTIKTEWIPQNCGKRRRKNVEKRSRLIVSLIASHVK